MHFGVQTHVLFRHNSNNRPSIKAACLILSFFNVCLILFFLVPLMTKNHTYDVLTWSDRLSLKWSYKKGVHAFLCLWVSVCVCECVFVWVSVCNLRAWVKDQEDYPILIYFLDNVMALNTWHYHINILKVLLK